MWSFEGDYKKKPKQSLSGKSRSIDRQTFLQKLKVEREEREDQRRRSEAVIKIQAWTRGIASRKRVCTKLRWLCNDCLNEIKKNGSSKEKIEEVICYLIKFFDQSQDVDTLLSICHILVKDQKNVSAWVSSSFDKWKFMIPRLVSLALKILNLDPSNKDYIKVGSHAMPLRLLEVVSYPDKWETKLISTKKLEYLNSLFIYLQTEGYYSHLRKIVLTKVPNIYELNSVPPTPLCESVLNLIIEPLKIVSSVQDNSSLIYLLHAELCTEIFTWSRHLQVQNVILPYLASYIAGNNAYLDSLLIYIDDHLDSLSRLEVAPSILFSVLMIVHSKKDICDLNAFIRFLNIAGELFGKCFISKTRNSSLSDSESESEEEEEMESLDCESNISGKCLLELNCTERVSWILKLVEKFISSSNMLVCFTKLFHHICNALKYKLQDCRLLLSVVLKRHLLLRPMWRVLTSLQQGRVIPSGKLLSSKVNESSSKGTSLLQVLSLGYPLTALERDALVPLLSTFSASLIAVLATLHDSELLGEDSLLKQKQSRSYFPFTIEEIVKMSATLRDVCVGLVELAHPDMRMSAYIDSTYKAMWEQCFKVCVGVVCQIHLRDTRRQFCPENHWLSSKVFLPLMTETSKSFSFNHRSRRRYRRLFEAPRWLTKDQLETEGPPLSIAEQRRGTLLHELPFVFPFNSRMGVFSTLVARDKEQFQSTADYRLGPSINITIRRTHIYEDAFEKLSTENEENMRLKMRVHLLNAVGLNEAGIDGGGIFREFLSELLKTAFDPNRGFFLLTRDNTLYPNPSARLIAQDYENHYHFIGRMFGKALYENLLVEIPLAGFFLSKLLGRQSTSVEFHYLDSLDPELCKNLLSLKNYEGDILDLGLDFTILNAELGQNIVEELMPNGANVPVSNENCIEYIYLMADYKLNKQIARQCQAFKEGIFDVLENRWLRLFNWREFQMLISGTSSPIDLEDFKSNTKYAGDYNDQHPTIVLFWRVVYDFTEDQRRQLLKFVTSCSRPPLLGFKDLFPSFCIHSSGIEEQRLPSASTCMNLLKLPQYKDATILKQKLLYAITSNAGFELS